MQIVELSPGVFVIGRHFRSGPSTAHPDFRGSSARRRMTFDVWSRRHVWVAQVSEAERFSSHASALGFLEAHRVELEVS